MERIGFMAEPKKRNDDLQKVKQLVKLMVDNDLVEVEIIDGENKISLKRPNPQPQQIAVGSMPPMAIPAAAPVAAPAAPQAVPAQAAAPAQEDDSSLVEIPSPIVGTFYPTPNPDADPFVKVGDSVGPDTVVCIIEAMKVMNEIKAEMSGKIEKVLCKAGQAVEYGQPLFKVRPD